MNYKLIVAYLSLSVSFLYGASAFATTPTDSLTSGSPPVVESTLFPITGGGFADNVFDAAKSPSLAQAPSGSEFDSEIGLNAITQPTCTNEWNGLPNGWTLTSTANVSACEWPALPGYYPVCAGNYCFNQFRLRSYYDIPVGGTLRYCSVAGTPSGWVVVQTNLPASCGTSGPDYLMQHVSCIAGRDTNCNNESNSIEAAPSTVVVPYGMSTASTTVNWVTDGYSNPCIWAKTGSGQPQLWACDGWGAKSAVWEYVQAGVKTEFWISPDYTSSTPKIKSTSVTGVAGVAPVILASPMVVVIPPGQSKGSAVVSYDINGSGYSSGCLWVQSTGGPQKVWSCGGGMTRTAIWNHVPKGGSTTIWLSPSQTSPTPMLGSVIVVGH